VTVSMTIMRRNDTRDMSPAEVKLVRIGHLLWLDRKKSLKSGDVEQVWAIDAALETVWRLKRELRAELKVQRAEESAKLRAYFAERKAA
jgi:hypothetical protein